MVDDDKVHLLKTKVIERSNNKDFIHHRWFIKYHLEIVEQIAHELCDKYPDANRVFVDTLTWLHDFEKIVNFDNQYNTALVATKTIMRDVGYSEKFIDDMVNSINQFNSKENLATAKIEIQIVSSSDAASHLVGPFIALYWYENPSKTIDKIQIENSRKIAVDWDKKVTIPEVKKAFQERYLHQLEVTGQLPASFLN